MLAVWTKTGSMLCSPTSKFEGRGDASEIASSIKFGPSPLLLERDRRIRWRLALGIYPVSLSLY